MNKKVFISLIGLLISFTSLFSQDLNKPRVIVTTDGEIDDQSSMVRFLMYTSDYDVAGIVQVNGVQKDGHSVDKWIEAQIDEYAACLPNLRIHNPNFPDAEDLLDVLVVGNENREDLHKDPPLLSDSEGAQLIINVLLDEDPRPVHILAWGGANTQANALWQIKENYSDEEWKRAAAKARLYCIWYQDGGGKWIEKNLPEIFIYESGAPYRDGGWRYVWDYMSVDYYYKNRLSKNPPELQKIMDKPWLSQHITIGHGPLCEAYPQDYTSEGDTPSFMPLINNGLEQHTNYTLGGWGGRPVYVSGNHLQDGNDYNEKGELDSHYTFQRWLVAAQNDWAARADWCVANDFSKANHNPIARIKGETVRTVRVGDKITVDASSSSDPDNNALTYEWWQYHEAGTTSSKINLELNHKGDRCTFVIPNEVGKQLHVILEVTDNGYPELKSYKRLICNIE